MLLSSPSSASRTELSRVFRFAVAMRLERAGITTMHQLRGASGAELEALNFAPSEIADLQRIAKESTEEAK